MSTTETARQNPFLDGPLGPLFLRTAAPIVLMMLTNGIQALIDAWFLGAYVGADALAAVTLMFPVFMLMSALSTLVSFGMASALARALGAGEGDRSRAIFAGAHGLALVCCFVLIVLFSIGGDDLAGWLANESPILATMGHDYISIMVWCSPVMFVLAVNGDALRCEGHLSLMAGATLVVSVANIVLTWLLVARLGYGVVGSAIGTVLAQAIALAIVAGFRVFGRTSLRWSAIRVPDLGFGWKMILALGAPQSLSFIGISLVAATIIVSAQDWAGDSYPATVAAYGIITRIMTFAYMVLMGLNMATQTIVGNNYGAGLWARSDTALKIGLATAIIYAAGFEITMLNFAGSIGGLFVDDAATIAEVGRIMPVTIPLYILAAAVLVVSGYLQAIGDARTALALTFGRTYLFTIPLVLVLPFVLGEIGIWAAAPASEALTALLALVLLWRKSRRDGLRCGVMRQGTTSS